MDMKRFVVKDLKETFVGKPRHEIHIEGCSHIKMNTYKVGVSTTTFEAETAEEVIKKDEGELYDPEWSPRDYKIAPCAIIR